MPLSPLHEDIIILKTQMGRVVSELESEKGTRMRSHSALDIRLTELERMLWKGIGAILATQCLLGLAFALWTLLKK